jgi:hypothetical protein
MLDYLIKTQLPGVYAEFRKRAEKVALDKADDLLDWVRDKVLGSASPIDDRIVLPIIMIIREAHNIDPEGKD